MSEENVTTIQLTSKRLKAHKVVAYFIISFGIISIVVGASEPVNENTSALGALLSLLGIVHLCITRIRIWWNHK